MAWLDHWFQTWELGPAKGLQAKSDMLQDYCQTGKQKKPLLHKYKCCFSDFLLCLLSYKQYNVKSLDLKMTKMIPFQLN